MPSRSPRTISTFSRQQHTDYWAYSPFDKPQFTSSACSIASVTMAINGLRGLPPKATQKVPTQQAVLKRVGLASWRKRSAEGGDGVTFAQMRRYNRAALDSYGMKQATVETFHQPRREAAQSDSPHPHP